MAESVHHLAKTVGLHGQWGLSSTFDFVQALSKLRSGEFNTQEPIKILLVQPSDVRHVLSTLCRLHRHHPSLSVHFYLLENPVETLARDLLLLELFLDFEIPVRQRANLFLEVYGNLKVQKRTTSYMETLGSRLRQFMSKVMDESNDHILNFSLLKHRQRDELEEALKIYNKDKVFNLDDYFDHRKRGYYEDRYDARKPLQDWDYHQSIRSRASIIHVKQYKEWRESGIAYQFGDQTYSEPNKSLLSYTEGKLKAGKDAGIKKEVMGLWGDIVCSPYFAYGVDCETPNKHAEGLFEILNKNTGTEQHRHHAVEVAVHHMFSLLWELEHGRVYQMAKAHDIFSGLGEDKLLESSQKEGKSEEKATEEVEAIEDRVVELKDGEDGVKKASPEEEKAASVSAESKKEEDLVKAMERAENITSCVSRIKVFTMTGSLKEWIEKNKLRGQFDAIFVSCRAAEAVQFEGFSNLFKRQEDSDAVRLDCLLAVETAKFLVPFNQEKKTAISTKIVEYAENIGLAKMQEPPVYRRKRDEADLEDDVLFFSPKA